jgi:amidase
MPAERQHKPLAARDRRPSTARVCASRPYSPPDRTHRKLRDVCATREIYLKLFSADGGAGIEALLREAGTERVHPLMQRVLEIQRANALTTAEFASLVARWDAFRSALLAFMERYDAILCPVCAFPGMVHGSTYERLESFSYTMTYNLTGWPAAVVRAGALESGLPIGVQIVARPWREDVALALAQSIEGSLGGYKPPAP